MSEENNQKVIVVQQRKTMTPMILAIIAGILYLPSLLCNAVCAAVIAEANKGSGGSAAVMLPSIASGLAFILCFFCKSRISATTGGLIIFLAVMMMIFHVILFNPLALISSILYIIAGAISVSNAKRPA